VLIDCGKKMVAGQVLLPRREDLIVIFCPQDVSVSASSPY